MFNQLVSQRIGQSIFAQPMPGDVLMINGSQSCFPFDAEDATILGRLESGDLHLTAAMWGRGRSICSADAAAWEIEQLKPWQEQLEGLERLGLNQERRSTRLMPGSLTVEQEAEDQFLLAFDLPAGSFATSVLRELAQVVSASGQPEPEAE